MFDIIILGDIMHFIIGHYKKSIFESDNGYVIGLFKVIKVDNDNMTQYLNKMITFTGYFHNLNTSDTYKLIGNFIEHEKYGEQFNTSSYERLVPEDSDSIITFLSSDLFKGIGKRKATKIVNVLGEKALDMILENKDNLYLIPGINHKDVNNINEQLINYQNSYQTILYLNDIGFNNKDALIIYNYYLEKTLNIINENIYTLINDLNEISFRKIDEISKKIGINRDDNRRIRAGIVFTITEICNLIGHTYVKKNELYNYVVRALKINLTQDMFESNLEFLLNKGELVQYNNHYYIKEMYDAEKNIAIRIKNISQNKIQVKSLINDIKDLEETLQIKYNDEQKKAISAAINHQMLIITGGPGTGKTTIIEAIVNLYSNINNLSTQDKFEKIHLLAPTGRASKRIMETTNFKASTIHRFLKWNKESNQFNINELNKINCDIVIVDEASMVDTYLLDNLFKGLPLHTKIILVGDQDQLPSFGPGQVLKDLIDSKLITTIKLKTLYRQGGGSDIITLAHNINNGINDDLLFGRTSDVQFIPCSFDQVMPKVLEICASLKNFDNSQVLAPIYKGYSGIDALNKNLQTIFNPSQANKKEVLIGDIIYREKDKILQLTNLPDENVFNGDIGFIEKINIKPRKEIFINYDNNIVRYTPASFTNFKHGYAISIHKSQGSEFNYTIIPLVKSYYNMLYRKLIYTAVTRCKNKLYLVGEKEALIMAINNNSNDIRQTSLKDFLNEYFS